MSARLRWALVVLALVGATCLAIGAEGGRWFWLGDSIAVGPSGASTCFAGECKVSDLASLEGSDLWRRAGVGAVGAGLIGAVALIALAGSLAARRGGKLAAGATLTAAMTAAVTSALFVAERPEVSGVEEQVGRGLVFYGAGLALALGVAVFVLRRPEATR